MIHGLLRKEFREQRPFLILGIAMLVLEVFEAVTQQIDYQPLSVNFYGLNDGLAIFQLLISFLIGSGLLIREIDGGTLGFLDALPITRAHVFFVKVGTAAAVLLIYPLGYLGLVTLLHLLSRQSLDQNVHFGLLATMFLLLALTTLVGLACGVLLGFLRNLSWMAFALLAIALKFLSNTWPRTSALNPSELLTIHFAGAHWRLPFEGIAIQSFIAALFMLLALWIFKSAGAGRGRSLQMQLSRPLISAALTVATLGICIGALVLYARPDAKQRTPINVNSNKVAGAEFTPTELGHAETNHYTFSYPAQSGERLQLFLQEADSTFTAVAESLNIDGGAAIDVDLSGSSNNTEGTAFHNRIRMHFGADAQSTLAHETTHVFARRLAGGEYERELVKMSVLNEGLARWTEQKLTTGSGITEVDRLEAAIVSSRHLFGPAELTDIESLARNADRNLQYPLGAALIDVFVSRYGAGAPRQLLLTLGRDTFPRDLEGLPLWQAAFQLSGFDLTLVFDDYSRHLNEWEAEFAETISAIPRPRGSLVRDEDSVGVELRLDGNLPKGARAVVRFRPQEDSPLRDYSTRRLRDDIAWYSLDDVANEEVCFQPGIETTGVQIFEPWTCLPLSSAVEIEEEEEEE